MRLALLHPRSLRGRLLLWLLTLHLAAACVTGWLTYVAYGRLVHHFMDDQMRLIADSYAANRKPAQLQPLNGAGDLERGAFVLQIWSADGRELLASSWPALAVPLQAMPGFSEVHDAPGEDAGWRVYTAAEPDARPGRPRVQIVQSDRFRQQRVMRRALLEGLPIALLLPVAMMLLWLIVSAALGSLGQAVRALGAQNEHHLKELSVAGVPDEIAPLVDAFNSLLARLRAAFAAQHSFVQDAAHELRSPIAALTLQIESLRPHVPPGEAAARFAQLEAGVSRVGRLVEQLLSLSRQEALPPSLGASVDVAALLRESLGQLIVLADQRGVEISFEGRIAPRVDAPASALRCVFDNLIDNALRYTPAGSAVEVIVHAVDGQAVVDVVDQGPGIPPEWLDRVFDRFFRVPGSGIAGSGLGLAIAQAAALRCGLRIVLHNRGAQEGGPGLLARVWLG